MLGHVIGVDEDVVEVYYDINIQHVAEDVIHEALKGCGSIGKSEWDDQPLKGAIASAESGFPFFAFCYADQVVGMAEVNFCENSGFSWIVEEVQN